MLKKYTSRFIKYILVVGGLCLSAKTSMAQEGDTKNSDTAAYMSAYGANAETAARNIEIQNRLSETNLAALEAQEWFGGLWIEHGDPIKIVVRTNDTDTATDFIAELFDKELMALIEFKSMKYSYARLVQIHDEASNILYQLGAQTDTSIDIKSGSVHIYTVSGRALTRSLAAIKTTMPRGAQILEVGALFQPETVVGGNAASSCTWGFTVKRSNGELGVSTAAHCSNTQR
ncbi:MAG: hypothetical protein AAFV29_10480, partial [Myxococcota bacterium]